jgi:hypothetical protein
MREINEVSKILNLFYQDKNTFKSKSDFIFSCKSIYNDANGLGDSIILTSVLDKIGVKNDLLLQIDESFLNKKKITNYGDLSISELSKNDWGGGHAIQRLQKSLGLEIDLKPKGKLIFDSSKVKKNKVFVHLKNDTDWKRNIPNSLNDDEINLVLEFLNQNKNYDPYFFNNNLNINQLIDVMSTCEYFLGIDSGPMHIAAAIELKSIVIINDPNNLIYLPKIKECEIPNAEWLYPQNTHLNRNGNTELVPNFTLQTLSLAFKGQIYPYWSDKYLSLLNYYTK